MLIPPHQIVDDQSANLGFPHEEKSWIPANHENMVKFASAQTIGYERVSYAISTIVEDGVARAQLARSRSTASA